MSHMVLFSTLCFIMLCSWSANAALVSCHSCSAVQMQMGAEEIAARMPAGIHEIKVLNITGADYHLYRIHVIRNSTSPRNPSDEVQLQTTRLAVANETQIRSQLRTLSATIDNIKNIASGKVLLPDTSPYQSAADALMYQGQFASYFSDFLNREHSGIQSAVFEFAATVETLAANLQIGASGIVSASTSLSSGVISWVVFPDGSEMQFSFNFVNDLANGLQLQVTLKPYPISHDSNGKRIPHSNLEAKNYTASDRDINIDSLINYLRSLHISINDGGGGLPCESTGLSCSSDGKKCTINYRCS